MSRSVRIVIGIAIWLVLAVWLWWAVDQQQAAQGGVRQGLVPRLWEYAAGRQPSVVLEMDEPLRVGVGDPIFVIDGPGSVRQVGEVRSVVDPLKNVPAYDATVLAAEAVFYPSAPEFGPDAALTYYATPDSMTWVVETMLPPQKRQEIAREVTAAFEAHRAEILAALRPIVEESVREALQVVEEELAEAIVRHRPALERLGARYQHELVEKELVPLVQNEIWPLVHEHAVPTANRVGLEIWRRVSLWRFGWRYLYDVSPLPERRRTEQEWNRFLEQEAFPILERHTDEFIKVVQTILSEAAANPKVREAARKGLMKIIDDPELHEIVWEIVRETAVENPRLREVLDRHWRGPKARQAFQVAADRLEPTVRRIGELMFGTREGGITPEFAAVLRNRILAKDRRWFVLEVPPDASSSARPERLAVQVRRDTDEMVNPFLPLD